MPDVPLFAFYFIEKVIRHTPESTIWSTAYYRAAWQAVFDGFHSFPLIALGLAGAAATRSRTLAMVFASMALHALGDFPLHHDDAHRHFFPLSDWRYVSPVSYWDPSHHGDIAGAVEVAVVLLASVVLFVQAQSSITRGLVAAVGGAYLAYFGYAFTVW